MKRIITATILIPLLVAAFVPKPASAQEANHPQLHPASNQPEYLAQRGYNWQYQQQQGRYQQRQTWVGGHYEYRNHRRTWVAGHYIYR